MPVIIILNIQCVSQAEGLLVNEAKHTPVPADLEAVKGWALKFQAKGFINLLLYLNNPLFTVGLHYGELQIFFSNHVAIVDDIPGDLTVDAEYPITGLKVNLSRNAAIVNRANPCRYHLWRTS